MQNNILLKTWQIASVLPLGKQMVSKLICHRIPFFKTIRPVFVELRPDYCQARMPKTKQVINHLGSIHAIAMCNMAEFTGGAMCEVSLPAEYRWIPKGMQVEYVKKATTDLKAIATPVDPRWSVERGDYHVQVEIFNQQNDLVFKAIIMMKVSTKK